MTTITLLIASQFQEKIIDSQYKSTDDDCNLICLCAILLIWYKVPPGSFQPKVHTKWNQGLRNKGEINNKTLQSQPDKICLMYLLNHISKCSKYTCFSRWMLCARLPARFASTIGPIQFRGSVEFQFSTNLSFMGLKHAQPCFSIAGNLRLEFVASERLQFYKTISYEY